MPQHTNIEKEKHEEGIFKANWHFENFVQEL